MRARAIAAGIVLISCVVGGQSLPSFEVASIRVHQDPAGEGTARRRGIVMSGARAGATAVEVRGLIGFAYGMDVDTDNGGDLPKEIASQRYDVQAKAEGDAELTRERAQQMMQPLLADRFRLGRRSNWPDGWERWRGGRRGIARD